MRSLICSILLLGYSALAFPQFSTNENVVKYTAAYFCPPCGCPEDGKHFDAPGICPTCNMSYHPRVTGLGDIPRKTYPQRTVAIVLFDGADIMDVTGPLSVFEHAGFRVLTTGKDLEPKRIGMHTDLKPDYAWKDLPQVDVLVVPGGSSAESNQDMELVDWLKERAGETDTVFSVCSGAFFLGLAGILDGQEATTFASLIPDLRSEFPAANVLDDVKYTNNGHVVTSSGLSSGIDASFEVVAKYLGTGRAQAIANRMEYPWKRRNDYARTHLAVNYLESIGGLVNSFATDFDRSEGDMQQWHYGYTLWEGTDPDAFMAFMEGEFHKLPDYQAVGRTAGRISGRYLHPVLGAGSIELEVNRNGKGLRATLTANRLNPVRRDDQR